LCRHVLSFPTRRSSDLLARKAGQGKSDRASLLVESPQRYLQKNCDDEYQSAIYVADNLAHRIHWLWLQTLHRAHRHQDFFQHDRSEEHTSELQSRENIV